MSSAQKSVKKIVVVAPSVNAEQDTEITKFLQERRRKWGRELAGRHGRERLWVRARTHAGLGMSYAGTKHCYANDYTKFFYPAIEIQRPVAGFPGILPLVVAGAP
jgi:hypothetical protein